MSETKDGKFSIATGVPTEPDVKRLRDRFGVPEEGTMVPYSEASELLGIDRHADRFVTVTTAWRKALYREHNVVMESVANKGWRCLPPNDRVRFSWQRYKGGLRRVWRASEVAEKTDRSKLGKDEVTACDHLRKCAAAIRTAIATTGKPLQLPDPQIKPRSLVNG